MSEADDIREFMGLVGKGRSKGPLQELIKALSPREHRRYLHMVKVDKHNRKELHRQQRALKIK